MERGHRIGRQQPLDNVRNLQAQNARVLEASTLNSSAGAADPSRQAFDSKKIVVGIFRRDGHEKRTVTATEIDFQRGNPSVHGSQIELFEIIRRDEFRRPCWIC